MEKQQLFDRIEAIYRNVSSFLNPEPIRVYKPQNSGNGAALKVQLRLEPSVKTSDEGNEYIEEIDGGLFVELAKQMGKIDSGGKQFPAFGWRDDSLVRAKFGMPDITGLLTAIREVRYKNKPVPTALRPKARDQMTEEQRAALPRQVSLFHKFGAGTTVITYTFEPESSTLQISKSATQRRSISLTLAEEVLFEEYLRYALQAFIRCGQR